MLRYSTLFNELKNRLKKLEISKKQIRKEAYSLALITGGDCGSSYYWWEEGFNECLLSVGFQYEQFIKTLLEVIEENME